MTINIGLTYDKGVILLADGRVVVDDEIDSENFCKIFKISNNASVALNGDLDMKYNIADLMFQAKICEKKFKKLSKEKFGGESKKIRLLKMADLKITPNTDLDDSPEEVGLEKIITNFDGEEMLFQETFRIYGRKNEILFDVKSIGMQYNQFVQGECNGVVAGIDIHGPRVIEVSLRCVEEMPWATGGIGASVVKTYLKDYFEEISGLNQTLELAIFCGVRSAQNYTSINTNFNVINIQEQNGKIVTRKVHKKRIEKITKFYSNKKGSFKPISK